MTHPLQLTHEPVARVEMLIRRPPSEVFEAFVDPAKTCKFWFTKSTGRLIPGKRVTWTWEMYNFSTEVDVKEVEAPRRIVIEWPYNGFPTNVEWIFAPHGDSATYVSITNSGFKGDGDKLVKDALSSTGGFTWVLAGLKALLEHGIELNLILDAYPKDLKRP